MDGEEKVGHCQGPTSIHIIPVVRLYSLTLRVLYCQSSCITPNIGFINTDWMRLQPRGESKGMQAGCSLMMIDRLEMGGDTMPDSLVNESFQWTSRIRRPKSGDGDEFVVSIGSRIDMLHTDGICVASYHSMLQLHKT